MIYKIYGPPGTGKTHRLINRAKAYVRIGTPLHKIGYFAFMFFILPLGCFTYKKNFG